MKEYTREEINHLLDSLETGELRVTEKNSDGTWVVHSWIKEAILAAFRLGVMTDMSQGAFPFYDKDTVPVRRISPQAGIRIVPGGSSIRRGAFIASSVVVMPPSYINIGAYVDEGTMVDSHALVGSCAQIGKHVHLSAASQVGGVLEPVGALPVIIEDNAFIGGNCGIYEGTIVRMRLVGDAVQVRHTRISRFYHCLLANSIGGDTPKRGRDQKSRRSQKCFSIHSIRLILLITSTTKVDQMFGGSPKKGR